MIAGDGGAAKLPEGKTCFDCVHFARCSWLVQAKGNWTSCDWSPSRFSERETFANLSARERGR